MRMWVIEGLLFLQNPLAGTLSFAFKNCDGDENCKILDQDGDIILYGTCSTKDLPLMITGQLDLKYEYKNKWAGARDFQHCGIFTSVDSDKPVQSPFKLRNYKCCSASSLIVIEYYSD